jgi:transposase-like protein
MRKGRFSEEQIINVLKEHQAGIRVVELCCKHGISDATFYTWRTKYGGMGSTAPVALDTSLPRQPKRADNSACERPTPPIPWQNAFLSVQVDP